MKYPEKTQRQKQIKSNLDGCWNCKYSIKTGVVKVLRCGKSYMMVDEKDKCSNYKNNKK